MDGSGESAVTTGNAGQVAFRVNALIALRADMLASLGGSRDAAGPGGEMLAALVATAQDPDAARRARLLTAFLKDIQGLIDLLSGTRNDAIRELRQTRKSSYDDVAELLGISKSRAQQLCKRLESGA